MRGDFPRSMSVPPVLPQDVIDVINSLKNKRGHTNEIPVSIIKGNIIQFAQPLSILFNQSVTTGKFPHYLKHATVIPIFKNGSKEEVNSYRPISLLNVFSKIFEKLMKKALIQFLDRNSIIHPQQYGFRSGCNTFNAINYLTEEIYKTIDSQKFLLSIYIDFSKAFDTVKHEILLKKMKFYGIRGVIYNWFKDYLQHRTQSTKFQSHISSAHPINYGVPQSSALGPILFLIYINDLPSIFSEFKTILFADDSTFYISGADPNQLIIRSNAELDNFYQWCMCNRLTVNLSKCKYMLFSTRKIGILPPLLYHHNLISRTTEHMLLGVIIDESLTFKSHISYLVLKLSRIVSLLYQLNNYVPTYILKCLYNAHVVPHLQYCTSIWANSFPTHLLPLFRLQKRIIRLITGSEFYAHSQPLFRDSLSLKLFDINKLHIATHMYKLLKYGNEVLHTHNYPTRACGNLQIPRHSLSLYKHSVSYSGPIIWNSIPEHIKNASTIRSFRNKYKRLILSQY